MVQKFDDMCIHLDTIPQRDRQTDRRTWYINIALCMLANADAQQNNHSTTSHTRHLSQLSIDAIITLIVALLQDRLGPGISTGFLEVFYPSGYILVSFAPNTASPAVWNRDIMGDRLTTSSGQRIWPVRIIG